MAVCPTHKRLTLTSLEKLPPMVFGKKQRDPDLGKVRVRDPGIISPKWDVSIRCFPSGLRKLSDTHLNSHQLWQHAKTYNVLSQRGSNTEGRRGHKTPSLPQKLITDQNMKIGYINHTLRKAPGQAGQGQPKMN